VESGKPAAAVNKEDEGGAFFEQFVVDIFPMSYPSAKVLAASFDFSSATDPVSVLDLAAGSGVWGIALAQSSPQVRVTAVDWPAVLPTTQKTVARFGFTDRFTFSPGDLLEADFGSGHQIATLGHILHSEGEERSRALLAKTYESLASRGTIAIAEFLVNKDRTGPPNALTFAVNMLVNTDVGGTYSFEEISEWLAAAGFVNARQFDSPGPSPLILATKP
jgi:precorrin-6B methylase 2